MIEKKKESKKITGAAEVATQKILDVVMKETAILAHKYFEQRGFQHGSHLDDWLRAEKEVKKKYGIK
jgi:hypothetical protein